MRPTVIEARDAARRLNEWLNGGGKNLEYGMRLVEARRDLWLLLEYHGTHRWQFGKFVSDFGEMHIVAGLPTDENADMVRWFESPAELIDHATADHGTEAADDAKRQLQDLGVTL